MKVLVTGGAGYIGSILCPMLLDQGHHVVLLDNFMWGIHPILHFANHPNLTVVDGDVRDRATVRKAMASVDAVFHLAAIVGYPACAADPTLAQTTNVDGTRHAVQLAEAIKAGCFHHTSSIAVAGLYAGVFREDMFDEAEDLDNPYFKTKHDSEAVVRKECDKIPFRIYRPGVVIGHSKTGEIEVLAARSKTESTARFAVSRTLVASVIGKGVSVFAHDASSSSSTRAVRMLVSWRQKKRR